MINKKSIINALEKLKKKRPLFHSEADFQHSLAWEIQTLSKKANIRLEKPFKTKIEDKDKNAYFDIHITDGNQKVAIELKYKTRKTDSCPITHNNEEFFLKDHSAQDCGRYDFLKDIERLETFANNKDKKGFAIFLTNVQSYWNETSKINSIDNDFKFNKNIKKGTLIWHGASPGTMKGREKSIKIKNDYPVNNWILYSTLNNKKHGEFKYILIEIK